MLSSFPKADLDALRPHLTWVSFLPKTVMIAAKAPLDHVYFPINGMVSILQTLKDGAAIEILSIGNTAMVGTPVLLGGDCMSGDAVVQLSCTALRLPTPVLQRQMERSPALRSVSMRFVEGMWAQIAQHVVCGARHSLRQQLARWLLAADDCALGAPIAVNHETLAALFGIRRASVTMILGSLKDAGIISNRYNQIMVVNRPLLEGEACECRQVLLEEYRRLEITPPIQIDRRSKTSFVVYGDQFSLAL